MVDGKGNSRGEDAISYGQSQWSVGTCNVLPVFVVLATSLGLVGRPILLYQIFSCGGFLKDCVFWRCIMTIQEFKQTIVEVAVID